MDDMKQNLAVLEVQEFETAFPVAPAERDAALRRFTTLLVDSEGARRSGANGFVTHAYNVMGEDFAVKRLRVGAEATPVQGDVDPQVSEASLGAFRAEFESQLAVANMRGFPRLYGYGVSGGRPFILMEWIEGVSLAELMDGLTAGNRLDESFVMLVGAALFGALARLDGLSSRLVHRDLSPGNVMIRESASSLNEQMASNDLDLCLIDFGSTTVLDKQDPRFTTVTNIMRHATPEYAPPEMLTDTLPDIIELRQSPAIDVYAACSIVYEMLAGHTPFMLAEKPEGIPYLVKTSEQIEPLRIDGHDDLAALVMRGLSNDQSARPDAKTLRDAFLEALGESAPIEAVPDRATRQGASSPKGTLLNVPAKAERRSGASGIQDAATSSATSQGANRISRRTFLRAAGIAACGLAVVGLGTAGALSLGIRGDGESSAEDASGSGGEDAGMATQPSVEYAGGSLYSAQDSDTLLWGYLNAQRQWVIPPKFQDAPGLFVDGLALVKDSTSGMYGYIGEDGEWKIDPKFESAAMFGEGLAFAQPADHSDVGASGKQGYAGWIDESGKWAIDPTFTGGGVFSMGLAAAMTQTGTGARWGYVDQSGQMIIPEQFFDARAFADNGLALAASHASLYGWIDQQGNWAIKPSYARAQPFSEGLAGFMDTWSEKWGYVDDQGNVAIGATFSSVRKFKSGLAACQDSDTELWGFIDQTGGYSIEPSFLRAGDFMHGLAPAQDADTGKFGYIDDTGYWVIPPQYASVNLNLMD